MIKNFNRDFFSKSNKIKLCTIALTGILVASPFMAKGLANQVNEPLKKKNEPTIIEELPQEENTSRISIQYEGTYNIENGVIIIFEKDDPDHNHKTDIIASISPDADDPYVDLTPGTYIIANYNDKYEIELTGEKDYSFTVNYQDGSIINNNEQEIKESHTK